MLTANVEVVICDDTKFDVVPLVIEAFEIVAFVEVNSVEIILVITAPPDVNAVLTKFDVV